MTTTRTPQDIDEELAALYDEQAKLTAMARRNAERCFRIAGFKKTGYGPKAYWPRTAGGMFEICRGLVERGDEKNLTQGMKPSEALLAHEETLTLLARAQLRIRELDAIWQRDRWNRYILCQSANGHIHNYTGCHTLRPTSVLLWFPEFSGRPVDEAVADRRLGPILCQHCFPAASAEYKRDPAEYRREQRAAENAAKAAEKARQAAEKAERAADRETARAARPVKVTARDRRNEALKEISSRYKTETDLIAVGREQLAYEIEELAGLGKTDAWKTAIDNWADAVRDEENSLTWAWFQFGVYAGYAA